MATLPQPLKIGILGCRGIPNRYGGYEQFAQYLSRGLVERGHEVFVYCSSLHPYQEPKWEGVHLLHQFDPEDRLGTAGQFVYDFNCLRDARSRNFDALLQLGYTSSAIFYPYWPRTCTNLIHMDGLEWKRSKYGRSVQLFLKVMEKWAARRGDLLIADSKVIQRYLLEVYGKSSVYIPYGTVSETFPRRELLQEFGLQAGKYSLVIARFVPENNLEIILEGYLASKFSEPLVLVGNCDNAFGKRIRRTFGSTGHILFPGAVYDFELLNSLRTFARLYFHGHSVGGTNPSLLEAMNCRVPICAHRNDFNRAVLGNDALYFSSGDELAEVLNHRLGNWDLEEVIQANYAKVRENYNWPLIVEQYEKLFYSCRAQDNRFSADK